MPALALRVMVCDLLVSLLAGVAVFPGGVQFRLRAHGGHQPAFPDHSGGLRPMPGGQFFTAIFFVLSSAVAAIGAMLCLLEIPVAWLLEPANCPAPWPHCW